MYSVELQENISDLTLHSMSGSASHCLIGICSILLSVVSRSYKHSVSGSELPLKRQAEAKMLSFEQPFISLCHQRQMPLSLQQSICTKMFSESENGWVSDPFSNKLNLTGICYNKNSFSKLTFTSSKGKMAFWKGLCLLNFNCEKYKQRKQDIA